MRFTLLMAAGVLAAGVGLAACSSGGGSQAFPGAQSVAPMSHSGLQFTVVGVRPDKVSCGSGYITCVTVGKGAPGKAKICVQTTTGTCPAPGTWTWKSKVLTLGGKPYKAIKGKIKPNPGDPITDTLSTKKKLKNSHGKVKYEQEVMACNSSSSCLTGYVGIATK
ncbi:MAG: hypothetical protein JO104_04820 [Candidatus Eremiobacteraeota bacterium]|nr:hypothetical protein [Candidatus Eremiobacteraeota bacterium]